MQPGACAVCGDDEMTRECDSCGGVHCPKHQPPANHDCSTESSLGWWRLWVVRFVTLLVMGLMIGTGPAAEPLVSDVLRFLAALCAGSIVYLGLRRVLS